MVYKVFARDFPIHVQKKQSFEISYEMSKIALSKELKIDKIKSQNIVVKPNLSRFSCHRIIKIIAVFTGVQFINQITALTAHGLLHEY